MSFKERLARYIRASEGKSQLQLLEHILYGQERDVECPVYPPPVLTDSRFAFIFNDLQNPTRKEVERCIREGFGEHLPWEAWPIVRQIFMEKHPVGELLRDICHPFAIEFDSEFPDHLARARSYRRKTIKNVERAFAEFTIPVRVNPQRHEGDRSDRVPPTTSASALPEIIVHSPTEPQMPASEEEQQRSHGKARPASPSDLENETPEQIMARYFKDYPVKSASIQVETRMKPIRKQLLAEVLRNRKRDLEISLSSKQPSTASVAHCVPPKQSCQLSLHIKASSILKKHVTEHEISPLSTLLEKELLIEEETSTSLFDLAKRRTAVEEASTLIEGSKARVIARIPRAEHFLRCALRRHHGPVSGARAVFGATESREIGYKVHYSNLYKPRNEEKEQTCAVLVDRDVPPLTESATLAVVDDFVEQPHESAESVCIVRSEWHKERVELSCAGTTTARVTLDTVEFSGKEESEEASTVVNEAAIRASEHEFIKQTSDIAISVAGQVLTDKVHCSRSHHNERREVDCRGLMPSTGTTSVTYSFFNRYDKERSHYYGDFSVFMAMHALVTKRVLMFNNSALPPMWCSVHAAPTTDDEQMAGPSKGYDDDICSPFLDEKKQGDKVRPYEKRKISSEDVTPRRKKSSRSERCTQIIAPQNSEHASHVIRHKENAAVSLVIKHTTKEVTSAASLNRGSSRVQGKAFGYDEDLLEQRLPIEVEKALQMAVQEEAGAEKEVANGEELSAALNPSEAKSIDDGDKRTAVVANVAQKATSEAELDKRRSETEEIRTAFFSETEPVHKTPVNNADEVLDGITVTSEVIMRDGSEADSSETLATATVRASDVVYCNEAVELTQLMPTEENTEAECSVAARSETRPSVFVEIAVEDYDYQCGSLDCREPTMRERVRSFDIRRSPQQIGADIVLSAKNSQVLVSNVARPRAVPRAHEVQQPANEAKQTASRAGKRKNKEPIDAVPTRRKRGRPRKCFPAGDLQPTEGNADPQHTVPTDNAIAKENNAKRPASPVNPTPVEPKRKRGRPRKEPRNE